MHKNSLKLSILSFLFLLSCSHFVSPEYSKGMVVAEESQAAHVGISILKKGGNAIDAAIATGFALAVTMPQAGNLGGGGYMIIYLKDGEAIAVDFRETAPKAATTDKFLDEQGKPDEQLLRNSARASGTPGTVMGYLTVLEKYGTMSREEVLAPAIQLAANGFTISGHLARRIAEKEKAFARFESSRQKYFPDGEPLPEGKLWKQPEMAATLQRISNEGIRDFYFGKTAELIERTMKKYNGLLSRKDLSQYSIRIKKPLRTTFNGYDVFSSPPSSSGGFITGRVLNLMGLFLKNKPQFQKIDYVTFLTRSFRTAYRERATYLGDPDFVKIPLDSLLSLETAMNTYRNFLSTNHEKKHIEKGTIKNHQTTHYSVIDQYGNAVAVTTTLNSWFGSGLVVDGAGFLMNNEMDDFSVVPGIKNQFGLTGNDANAIVPGKRMLSSQSPTIVVRNLKPILILGAPGGSRIPSSVIQVILNKLVWGLPMNEAVNRPRIHYQWVPDTLYWEKGALDNVQLHQLQSAGFKLKIAPFSIGRVQAIYIDTLTGRFEPGVDYRSPTADFSAY